MLVAIAEVLLGRSWPGGPAATKFVDGTSHDDTCWLRVWGARWLLWVSDDAARPEILRAIGDESWRVREMALKVIARHLIGDFVTELAAARRDPAARVRQAADRALKALTASGE